MMNSIPSAFVVMPFAPEFDEIYEYLIRGALSDAGFNVIRADDIRNQGNILGDVVQGIVAGDLVVADLTTANPNVYYELGLAHAVGKPTILLVQDIDEIPFDLRSYRILTYSTHFSKMNEAREELKGLAIKALENGITFGNPMSDFFVISSYSKESISPAVCLGAQQKRDERGLIDFQSALEEGLAIITSVVSDVGGRFNLLTPEIQATVERLQNNTSTAKRKFIVQQLAASLDDYAKWLRSANERYRVALGQIGESLSVLFSGEFQADGDSKSELQNLVNVLKIVEEQAGVGQMSFTDLITTMDTLPRIEREFNRANRNVSEELKELVGNVDQTVAVLARARNATSRLIES